MVVRFSQAHGSRGYAPTPHISLSGTEEFGIALRSSVRSRSQFLFHVRSQQKIPRKENGKSHVRQYSRQTRLPKTKMVGL